MKLQRWMALLLISANFFLIPLMAEWKAGVAVVEITPEVSMWMAGYGARTRPSEGTLQPLWLKVLALEDASANRSVFVSSDLLGFPREISRRIVSDLMDRLSLRREQIMLTSSHTHCGPVLEDALMDIYELDQVQLQRVEAYSRRLEAQVVKAAVRAFETLVPAELSAGQGEAGFAVNRRNNLLEDVLAGRPLRGPVDHSVPVLRVGNREGDLLAIVFGYACHNTTLDIYQWCGDYAGYTQEYLERDHPGTTALFFSGCGADANPLPRRTIDLCQVYGRRLSQAVNQVLNTSMTPLDPILEASFREIDLPLEPPPDRVRLREIAVDASSPGYMRRWAERVLAEIDEGKPQLQAYPYPVQVWRLGRRQSWVALGGEVVVDYALRLKQELGSSLWVTAYANDVMAYIPSLRVLREGGYEGYSSMMVYGLPSTWKPAVEELIIEEVHRQIRNLNREP